MKFLPPIQGKGSGAPNLSSCFLKQKLLSLPGQCRSEETLERSPWNGKEKDGVVPTSLALPHVSLNKQGRLRQGKCDFGYQRVPPSSC